MLRFSCCCAFALRFKPQVTDQLSNIVAGVIHISFWSHYLSNVTLRPMTHKPAPVSMIDDRDIDLGLIQNRAAELDEESR